MNVRTVSANIWQNNKTGNSGDPYSSSLYNSHEEQQQACTNTYEIMETSTLSGKVTQPTSSINFIRRGNETLMKQSETLTLNGVSNAIATKQISHDLNSNENTIFAFSEKNNNKYSHDEQGNNQPNEYRLLLLSRNMNGADECKIYHNNNIINKNNKTSDNNDNVVQMPSLSLLSHHNYHHHHNIHPQMPSSSQQHQPQKFVQTQKFTNNPVSLTTNNVSNDAQFDASTALLNVPCTSSVLSFQNCSNNEYQMTTTEAAASTINKYEYDNKLTVDANHSNSVDVQKMMNCVNVECYINNNNYSKNNENIDNELQCSENNKNNEQTTMSAQTTASADNLIITSAIENISTATTTSTTTETMAHGTPNKTEKYSNDIITMREKRRRDRRDRRLARTRALNGSGQSEILPDVLNNPRPPPYSSLPSQPIIPSIISTVPVNDTRYIFSLPLVRR